MVVRVDERLDVGDRRVLDTGTSDRVYDADIPAEVERACRLALTDRLVDHIPTLKLVHLGVHVLAKARQVDALLVLVEPEREEEVSDPLQRNAAEQAGWGDPR